MKNNYCQKNIENGDEWDEACYMHTGPERQSILVNLASHRSIHLYIQREGLGPLIRPPSPLITNGPSKNIGVWQHKYPFYASDEEYVYLLGN